MDGHIRNVGDDNHDGRSADACGSCSDDERFTLSPPATTATNDVSINLLPNVTTALTLPKSRTIAALRLDSAFCVTARVPMVFSVPIKQASTELVAKLACTIIPCSSVHPDARPIALLTVLPVGALPSLPLRYEEQRTMPAPIALPDEVAMSTEQRQAAYSYTLRVLAFCALEARYEAEEVPYLLLPAKADYTVDWDEVIACARREDVVPLPGSSLLASASGSHLGALQDRIVYQGTDWWNERLLCPIGLRRKGWLESHGITPLLERQDGRPVPVRTPLSDDDLLLEVRSIPKQTDMRQLDRESVLIRHGYVLPMQCYVGALSASMLRSARMLPSIMTAYEATLLARECNETVLQGALKNERSLQEALTTPSSDAQFNYQRLEFLGDCVLKLIASCVMFSRHGDMQEGGLTQKRQAVICNDHLRRVGVRCKLAEYATNHKTFQKRWFVPGTAAKVSLVSDKMQADIVEAVLGAAWLDGGLTSVLACCTALSIFDTSFTADSFQRSHDELGTPSPPPSPHSQLAGQASSGAWLSEVEEVLGYCFRRPHLAKQALTHASLQGEPSYERLEFLGDAVLDICLVQLLQQLYGRQTEEGYTVLKGNALSNVSLAVACLSSGLPRLLRHSPGSPMGPRFDAFRGKVSDILAVPAPPPPARRAVLPWLGVDDAPKQLADIVESTIGAVFVDAGFQLEEARGVFNKLFLPHFLTYFHPDVLPLSFMPAIAIEAKGAA